MSTTATDLETSARLALLDSYQVLGTPPEQDYDDLATIAASICGTPIGMVTFVASDHVYFKSRIGIPAEVDRCVIDTLEAKLSSFCNNCVLADVPVFVVNDSLADARWHKSSLVTCERPIRFYGGAVLVAPSVPS